jgi:thiosulfate dehydrogenase
MDTGGRNYHTNTNTIVVKELRSSWFPILLGLIILVALCRSMLPGSSEKETPVAEDHPEEWHAPDINLVAETPQGDMIRYGRELIVNTSRYLGPKGMVESITNGMNCQNCHVEAGTRPFGSSFATVASTFPKFRERSGRIESIEFRINECLERSLNGKSIDSGSNEMRAMVAYFKWIGKDVIKGTKIPGLMNVEIPYLERAADPQKGKLVFESRCESCHGSSGEGVIEEDSSGYRYPPLWGPHSYNISAGLYRIPRLATFVKYNMPFTAIHIAPQLTDEEAWDVAAYINSQPRADKFFEYDWPNKSTKPVDYPYGPYTDGFSEQQHKYGPFIPIIKEREKQKGNSIAH